MSAHRELPPTHEVAMGGAFLEGIERRMERQNQRMLVNLIAWAEILDALGWSVALSLPGQAPFLSARVQKWAEDAAATPLGWEEITARLKARPPARHLVCAAEVHVWADATAAELIRVHPAPLAPLTKREAEVLGWLREGKTGPEIAIILQCAQRTVESHVARIYRKLGVRGRAQLLFRADSRND